MTKIFFILALTLFSTITTAQHQRQPSPMIWHTPFPQVLKPGISMFGSDSTTTCNAAAAGSIRYNAGTFEACNGSAWSSMSGGGGGSVASVTASAPLSSSGGANPNITFSGDANLNPDGVTTLREIGNLFTWGTTRSTRFSPPANVVITGDIASGTNTILNVSAPDIAKLGAAASAYEISNTNFPVGTFVISAVGTTVTVAQNATGTAAGASVTFVGVLTVRTENQTGALNSGDGVTRTGNTVSGATGILSLKSGDSSGGGLTGDVFVHPGTTAGTRGILKLGLGADIQARTGSPLKFMNTANTFSVGFQAGTLAANTLYTWPTADGTSGYVLSTNGAGILSWAPAGSPTGTANTVAYFNVSGTLVSEAEFYYNDTNNTLSFAPGISLGAATLNSLFFGPSQSTTGTVTNSLIGGNDITVDNSVDESIILGDSFPTGTVDNSAIFGSSHQSSGGSVSNSIIAGFNHTWTSSQNGAAIFGQNNNASATVGSALIGGNSNVVSGQDGLTGGIFHVVAHNRSLVAGYGNETTVDSQTLVGQFSAPAADSAFVVGYGADSSNRANVFEVKTDGKTKLSGTLQLFSAAADPGSPVAGQIYYNSTLNKLKFYNGTTWEVVTSL